jgi:hypothetical protein
MRFRVLTGKIFVPIVGVFLIARGQSSVSWTAWHAQIVGVTTWDYIFFHPALSE